MTATRYRLALVPVLFLAFSACRITDVTLWAPPPPPADACEVDHVRNVAYRTGPEATSRHRLDLFLPHGRKDFPVVVFVHGGAWLMGDNRCCGLYSGVGEFLARHGIGAVLPNYRLSPGVKHPEHIRDVARAVAWSREQIAEHGGRPDQLFLCGHSAGGHLVSLLGTDEQYLKAEGLKSSDVKGVMSVSGVYDIKPGSLGLSLGGKSSSGLRGSQLFPLRGSVPAWCGDWSFLPGIPFKLNIFGPAFGNDPAVRRDASPQAHVRPGLPPFLIVHADNDLPTLADMAKDFHRALGEQGCDSTLVEVAERNHHTIVFRALQAEDPVGGAILKFVRRHTRP